MAKSQYVMARIREAKEKSELLSLSCKSKRHVEKFNTRHGRTIYYYRKGKGHRIRLPDPNIVGEAHFNRLTPQPLAAKFYPFQNRMPCLPIRWKRVLLDTSTLLDPPI